MRRSTVDSTEVHQLSLFDVRVLDMLDNAPAGCARMGDLAEALPSLPSRLTRQIRRLEGQGLVRREASRDDRRGVVATITEDGRTAARQAMVTYSKVYATYFLGQLSRSQIAAMGENCRRISAALKTGVEPAGRSPVTMRRRAEEEPGDEPLPLSAVAWQSGLMHSP